MVAVLAGGGCNGPAPQDADSPVEAPPTVTTPDVPSVRPAAERPAADLAPGYRMPSSDVVDIVDAPPTPWVVAAPGGKRIGLWGRQALPSIEVVTMPFERLAGVRIHAQRHARRRTRWITSLDTIDVESGKTTPIKLPETHLVTTARWSPDGVEIAYTVESGVGGLELWVANPRTGDTRRLGNMRLSDVTGSPFVWMPGSDRLLVREIPPGLGEAPPRPKVPPGPTVEDTSGKAATNRTYQDLLRSPADGDQFEHYATTRLGVVDLDGKLRPLGEPALYTSAEPSPDGKYVLAQRMRRPFSYSVPYYRFARVIEVLDEKAKVVRRVADQDVADQVPIQGVRTGPRSVHWQPGRDATVVWTEALDGGDPRKEVEHRDRLMTHAAPFADTPEERLRVEHRLSDTSWTSRAGEVLVTEYDRDRRWVTTRLHQLDDAGAQPHVLFDRSSQDVYGHPGWPVTETRPDGTEVVIVDDGHIFLSGSGASPDGDRPFVDRMELSSGTKTRLMKSEGDAHQQFVDFVGEGHETLLVRREASDAPPNFFALDEGGERRLTEFPDPHPQLTGIRKRILTYSRKDGLPLSGTLYLPPDYEEGQRLPLVIWAYPLEYASGDTAGQVRAAPRKFTRLSGTSPLMFLTQGYAVLSGAAMPVVGDPESMNDTFIEQIAWAAEAAIDAAVEAGVADRDRVGVAGHSYGAFMTANLLGHTQLFRAGIARSGAYNRTLTPFGFQSERRTLWEATDTYVNVSPLFTAHTIDEPLLLIHGEVDNNSGTYPLQSRRLFRALQGNGGTARLVMLPGESHGYAARESVLHVLAESFEWFDAHVKNAEPRDGRRPPVAIETPPTTSPKPGADATERPAAEPKNNDPSPGKAGTTDSGSTAAPTEAAKPKAPAEPEPTPKPPTDAAQPAKPEPKAGKADAKSAD